VTERNKGRTQEQAAAKANLSSRKTVSKYEQLGQLPGELKQPRTYRTREDPFGGDWPELEKMLEQAPELDAKTLFEWLCERQPEKYQEGQLRTMQRHVSTWRALHSQKVAVLEQCHRPGEVLQTDGTWMNTLGITLGGQAFPHLLIHSVLPYSNWEWGRVAQSESLLAIRLGLQSTLAQLGHVPAVHQTDNSTAATHQLGPEARDQSLAERGYNEGYLQLMTHFGTLREPRTIHVDAPNENGDTLAPERKCRCRSGQWRLQAGGGSAPVAARQPGLRRSARLRTLSVASVEQAQHAAASTPGRRAGGHTCTGAQVQV